MIVNAMPPSDRFDGSDVSSEHAAAVTARAVAEGVGWFGDCGAPIERLLEVRA